jgi:ribosomal protein S18 acetylase RimI-like enzyme
MGFSGEEIGRFKRETEFLDGLPKEGEGYGTCINILNAFDIPEAIQEELTDQSKYILEITVTQTQDGSLCQDIMGFIIFTPQQNGELKINQIYVDPQYREQGIARKLFDRVLAEPANLTGTIRDTTGKIMGMAKKAGAVNVRGNDWELTR